MRQMRLSMLLSQLLLLAGLVLAPDSGLADPQLLDPAAAGPLLTVHKIPYANSLPRNIAVQSPGHVWFTMAGVNAIGSLAVGATDSFNKVAIPTPNSEPYDLAYTGGVIWFTERLGNKLGRLDLATHDITEYPIPTANSGPTGIAVAANGLVWFAEQGGNKLGRFDPALKKWAEYPLPRPNSQPEDLVIAGNGSIWLTLPGVRRVLEFDPVSKDFSENLVQNLSGATFAPYGIAIEQNLPWISTSDVAQLGRFAPGTLTLWKWFALPPTSGPAAGIAFRSGGGLKQVWFVEPDAGRVGRLDLDVASRVVKLADYALPLANSRPLGIAVDAGNHGWITANGANAIVEWRPASHAAYLPLNSR